MDEWIPVDGYKNLPVGTWLVEIESESMFGFLHTANVGKNVTTIGGNFAFDVPKVVAYQALPERYINHENGS